MTDEKKIEILSRAVNRLLDGLDASRDVERGYSQKEWEASLKFARKALLKVWSNDD